MRSVLVKIMSVTALAATAAVVLVAPQAASAATSMTLKYQLYAQRESWNCGPFATRMALSTVGVNPWTSDIAEVEGTDENGTDSVVNVAHAMNYFLQKNNILLTYHVYYPTGGPGLQTRLVGNINQGHGIVVNVVNYQQDVNGITRGYGSGGHYVAVVGYGRSGGTALIADPGNGKSYYMDVDNLYRWIGGGARGIAATAAMA